MKTKICNKCNRELPIIEFGKEKYGKDGLKAKCKECYRQYAKKYRTENKKKICMYIKDYLKKDKFKEYQKKYVKINAEKYRTRNRKRYSLKKQLTSTLTIEQWEEIKLHFNNKCAYCGRKLKLEQDHFIPVKKGGTYTYNNIIPSCKSCNCSKKDDDFFDWYPKYKYYSKTRKEYIIKFLNHKK